MAETDARKIVDGILDGSVRDTEDELYISDLVVHAREFELELDFSRAEGGFMPCVERGEGELAPISFAALGLQWPESIYLRSSIGFSLRERWDGEGIIFLRISDARDLFRNGMVRFLTSRIGSLSGDSYAGLDEVKLQLPLASGLSFSRLLKKTSGFNITVSTATSGLRIHSSPTFRRRWSYFGSPSSPIKHPLPGGIYEFGADGGPYSAITPDIGTFDIPYKTTSPGLNL
jgi:hypothetical protein